MIIEISTIEFISFIGNNYSDIEYISYSDIYKKAIQIERRVKNIRIDLTERDFRYVMNRYNFSKTGDKISIRSSNFHRILNTNRLSDDINSLLLEILSEQ